MKNTLAAILLISFSLSVSSNMPAQKRGTQRAQVAMAGTGRMDLNTALIDLDRVSQATLSDIANMHVEKWKSGWKPGFMKGNSHQAEAQQAATSLQRNLSYALPGLIHDVQNSRGSLSTTFKLYDDVSLVCEAVDSLINVSEAAGKKNEAAPLGDDYSALTRIRRSLSAYIQLASASWENHGKAPYAALSAPPVQPSQRTTSSAQSAASRSASQSSSPQIVNDQGVKKIIVDDTVPEKKSAPKKKPETFNNL
ncbi:MAG TPA: hypothetical protein VFQ41_12220 [Candidatus Angelobacter sp.]|nr:hypothetical protein [Candidatus Angelobacter sp.]